MDETISRIVEIDSAPQTEDELEEYVSEVWKVSGRERRRQLLLGFFSELPGSLTLTLLELLDRDYRREDLFATALEGAAESDQLDAYGTAATAYVDFLGESREAVAKVLLDRMNRVRGSDAPANLEKDKLAYGIWSCIAAQSAGDAQDWAVVSKHLEDLIGRVLTNAGLPDYSRETLTRCLGVLESNAVG